MLNHPNFFALRPPDRSHAAHPLSVAEIACPSPPLGSCGYPTPVHHLLSPLVRIWIATPNQSDPAPSSIPRPHLRSFQLWPPSIAPSSSDSSTTTNLLSRSLQSQVSHVLRPSQPRHHCTIIPITIHFRRQQHQPGARAIFVSLCLI